jgi:hypothetical protein
MDMNERPFFFFFGGFTVSHTHIHTRGFKLSFFLSTLRFFFVDGVFFCFQFSSVFARKGNSNVMLDD